MTYNLLKLLRSIGIVLGSIIVTYGVYLFSKPLGYIIGGFLLLVISVNTSAKNSTENRNLKNAISRSSPSSELVNEELLDKDLNSEFKRNLRKIKHEIQ